MGVVEGSFYHDLQGPSAFQVGLYTSAVVALAPKYKIFSLIPRPLHFNFGPGFEISLQTTRVGVSMEMPSFTMTSFQIARGQVRVAWLSTRVETLTVE